MRSDPKSAQLSASRFDTKLTPDGWRAAFMAGAKAKGGEVNVRGLDHLVAQSIALKSAPALPVTDHVR
jgi:hypothetical protein